MRPKALPFIRPAEPKLAKTPPSGSRWCHELKWDGWRLQITKDDSGFYFRSRRGRRLDLPQLAKRLEKLPARTLILDAELVACDNEGRCDFAKLTKAMARSDERPLLVRAFDIMHLNGRDLCPEPLQVRQKLLARLIAKAKNPRLLLSESFTGDPQLILAFAESHQLEGTVSKHLDTPYRSGPTRSWIKCKTTHWRTTRLPQLLEAKGKRARSRGGDTDRARASSRPQVHDPAIVASKGQRA